MTTFETLWQQLATEAPAEGSLLYRRLAGVVPDVYAGLRRRSERALALALAPPLPDLKIDSRPLQDVRVETLPDPLHPRRHLLLLTLLNPALSDVFSVVCEDLVQELTLETRQEQCVRVLLNRLDRWRALFENHSPEGLSDEAQRGLFGELYFLRLLLEVGIDPDRALGGWTGPERTSQDFSWARTAVEVKTSVVVSPESFQVSNARQLDDTGLEYLFVFFLSMSSIPERGETLNQLADTLADRLSKAPALLNRFRLRLCEAGYFPQHRPRYDQPGYEVRDTACFRVSEGFPRLRETDLPAGVGQLRYAVSLAACAPFRASHSELFQIVTTSTQPDSYEYPRT